MRATKVSRELFAGCTVSAVLKKLSLKVGWDHILQDTTAQSIITDSVQTAHDLAVVADKTTLSRLSKYISTCEPNSFELGPQNTLVFEHLNQHGEASGSYITMGASADSYAVITLLTEPISSPQSIEVTITDNGEVPQELHGQGVASAILDGICVAVVSDLRRIVSGFRATVIDAQWHDVDSHAGAFKLAAKDAMAKILIEIRTT